MLKKRKVNMNKVLVVLAVVVMLVGCGLTKEDLGMARSKPDETQVVAKKRGLVVPPDYDVRPQ
jgi:uncharacterized lipoprotein YajG